MIHFERAPVSICLVLLEIVCSAWKFCFHARIQSVWSIERERGSLWSGLRWMGMDEEHVLSRLVKRDAWGLV